MDEHEHRTGTVRRRATVIRSDSHVWIVVVDRVGRGVDRIEALNADAFRALLESTTVVVHCEACGELLRERASKLERSPVAGHAVRLPDELEARLGTHAYGPHELMAFLEIRSASDSDE